MTRIYSSACVDCCFTFEHPHEAATRTVAERHARVRGHEVVFGSYAGPDRPTANQEAAR